MKIAAAKVKEMIAAKRISFASMLPEVGANIYAQKERLNYGGDNPKPDPEDVYKRQVEDVANIATFLASDMSSYVSGQVIQVDGGMNM